MTTSPTTTLPPLDNGHFYVVNSKYTFVYKPEEYSKLDDAFKLDIKTSREDRIKNMVEKTPLPELPKDLIPKYKLGVLPPLFQFGIPVTLESFYNLAVAHNFAVYAPGEEQYGQAGFLVNASLNMLWNIIYQKFNLDCAPRLCLVYSAQDPPSDILLSFLTSFQGCRRWPCDPMELGERVKEYLDLKEPLGWYLDLDISDWHAGKLCFKKPLSLPKVENPKVEDDV